MPDSANDPRKRVPILALLILATALAVPAWAHDESASSIEARLHGLTEDGAITEVQHRHIEELYFNGHVAELDAWLNAQERTGQISRDTHIYLNAMLGLGEPEVVPLAPAPAGYSGNGNVTKLGQLNPQPPVVYYNDNTPTGTLGNDYLGYYSGENGTAANRPQLVVTYQ